MMVPQPPTRAALLLLMMLLIQSGSGCEWGGGEEVRKFVRVREDAEVGETLLTLNVTHPNLLSLTPHSQESEGLFVVGGEEEDDGGGGGGRMVVGAPLQPLMRGPSPVTKLTITCGDNPVSVQVTVYVEDVNDHAPVFLAHNITVTVDELTPVGLTILPEIRVRDDDKPNTANSEVELELVGGNEGGFFTMDDRKRGSITLAHPLDYDTGPERFLLAVLAKDMGSPSLSTTATITVIVLDADDLPPVFSHKLYTATIPEHPGPDTGAAVHEELSVLPGALSAHDGDVGQDAGLRYSLVDSTAASFFTIHPDTGHIFVTKHLDRETLADNILTLHVRAEQIDNHRRVGSCVLEVTVQDTNDNLPEFTHAVYAVSIMENLPSGFSVMQVAATDADEGLNGAFNYHVIGGGGALAINPISGWLTVANQSMLDREESPIVNLHVCANQITPMVKLPTDHKAILDEMEGRKARTEDIKSEDMSTPVTVEPTEKSKSVTQIPLVIASPTTSEGKKQPTHVTVPLLRPVYRPTPTPDPNTTKEAEPKPTRSRRQRLPIGGVTRKIRKISSGDLLSEDNESFRKVTEDNTTLVNNDSPSEVNTFGIEWEILKESTTDTPIKKTLEFTRRGESIPIDAVDANEQNDRKAIYISLENPTPPLINSPQLEERISPHVRPTRFQLRQEAKGLKHTEKGTSRLWKRSTHLEVKSPANMKAEEKPLLNSESTSCAKIELNLLDANDNNPKFLPTNQYQFTIGEEAEAGDTIGTVLAKDSDDGENGLVTYKIQTRANTTRNSLRKAISVDKFKGVLMLVKKLPPGQVTVFIEAADSPSNPSETRTSLAVVIIDVKATHSWEPRFIGSPFEFWVGGDAPIGTSVGQVRVVDLPGPERLFDMFHSYPEGVPFAIEESSGIVSVVSSLQQHSLPTYDFEAVVTDGHDSLATNLTIHVAPAPRSATRRDIIISFSVQENLSGGVVGDVVSALRAAGARLAPEPHFELVNPEARRHFALAQDATLYTVAPLDYEDHPNHTLVIVSARTSDIYYINVQVEDMNDNAPQLNAVSYEGTLRENALSGSLVRISPNIQVVDRDQYPGSSYTLQLHGEASSIFSIDSSSGQVTFVGKALDREETEAYYFVVVAQDDGNLTSTANLTITVGDINDNAPKFLHREPLFSAREHIEEHSSRKLPDSSNLETLADLERSLVRIEESLPIGSRVTQLEATDEDAKQYADLRYAVVSEKSFSFSENSTPPELKETKKFSIEPKTGTLIVAANLEADHFYLVNVSATDGGGLSSHTTVTIAVFDVNDHTPRFERPLYNFEVVEGEYLVGDVGKVLAYDQDHGKNAQVRYQIIFYNETETNYLFPFRIVETSGTILATGSVDREEQEMYEFTVVAKDMGDPQLSSSVLVHIDITDVNDHPPVFYSYKDIIYPEDSSGNYTPIFTATVNEDAPKHTVIATLPANDSDSSSSGNGIILYRLEGGEDKFAIDSKNGSVYTVGSLDYELHPQYNLTVVAQDLGTPSLSATALLKVTITDMKEELTNRLFDREEYQVLVLENNNTPLLLLDLNVSAAYHHHRLQYQLSDPRMRNTVAIDSRSGQVYLTSSLDRETKDHYRFKVRATPLDHGRALQPSRPKAAGVDFLEYTVTSSSAVVSRSGSGSLLPPLPEDKMMDPLNNHSELYHTRPRAELVVPAEVVPLEGYSRDRRKLKFKTERSLGNSSGQLDGDNDSGDNSGSGGNGGRLRLDEVWVTVVVEDQNDNSPTFLPRGRPIVAAIPATASYGHFVTRIVATDPDLGRNGEVRYEMLPGEGAQDASTRFTVDPATGQVVVVSSLDDDVGEMFGFDVRATDQQGATTGRTAIANVFVHVLGAGGHLVVEVGASPRVVEPHLRHIQGMLSNVSGLEVRVQRLAPHVDGDAAHTTATDVYVYAVDPVTQDVVKAVLLRQALRGSRNKLRALLPSGLNLRGMRLPPAPTQGYILQTAELAILVSAVVVFLVTVTAIACLCYKQRKRRRKPMPLPPLITAGGVPVMPLAYPGPFGAPYTHMSDHSSADSSETQDPSHDHPRHPHDHPHHYPHEAPHYPQEHQHRHRKCKHHYNSDLELQHSCGSERVSSHTDDDDSGGACLRHAPSRKRRRGPGGGAPPSHPPSRPTSRAHHHHHHNMRQEHSGSDLDERDHTPPHITIPVPRKCCANNRPARGMLSPGLPTVDCTLDSSTRPHSPDSLEQHPPPHPPPLPTQAKAHIHPIPRTHIKRDRTNDQASNHGTNKILKPSDVTEL